MNLIKLLFIIFVNILYVNQASALSAEIYKDNNITINKTDIIKEIESYTDKINPVDDVNKEGIKTSINSMPISFSDNITVRGADKGCFNSNVEIYSFDKNKQINKDIVTFKRSENPSPPSLSFCLFGSTSLPDYVTKFHNNLFFISSYGITYYNLQDKKKIFLPLFLNKKNSIVYTLPYKDELIIVIDNINSDTNFYQVNITKHFNQ